MRSNPKPLLWVLILFSCVFFPTAGAVEDSTTRVEALLALSVKEANTTIMLTEGDDFNVSAWADCFNSSCGTVEIDILLCSGTECSRFSSMSTDSFNPVYSRDDPSYTCLMIDKGQTCSHAWSLRAKKAGKYVLTFFAKSTNTVFVSSDPVYLIVSGCGDGLCSGDETVVSCARDCCEDDCTAFGQDICLAKCSGYYDCYVAPDCDGKPAGYKKCAGNSSYISCCSEGLKRCEYGAYCLTDRCINCSTACDGVCESTACYRVDPDCDSKGQATLGCCGNDEINSGEECDGKDSYCPGACADNCRCLDVAATTSSFDGTSFAGVPATEPVTTLPEAKMTLLSAPASIDVTTTLAEAEAFVQDQGLDLVKMFPVILFFVAIILVFFLFAFTRLRKVDDYFDGLKDQEADLEKERSKAYSDYSSGAVSEDEASRIILRCDESLASLRKKIAETEKRVLK